MDVKDFCSQDLPFFTNRSAEAEAKDKQQTDVWTVPSQIFHSTTMALTVVHSHACQLDS